PLTPSYRFATNTKRPTLTQLTATFVTSAVVMLPLPPLVTLHIWAGFVGWVCTVTLYAPPLGMVVLNLNAWEPPPAGGITATASVPLSDSTTPLALVKPATVPLTEYWLIAHVTDTFVMLVLPTMPEPFAATWHV